MNKIHNLILLAIGVVLMLGSGAWLWYSRYADRPLNCVGNVEWNIGSNRFTGTVSYRLYDHQGLATLTGKLYGRHVTGISRNIYFTYTQHHDARVLQSTQLVKTFSDSADKDDINGTLPSFYRETGQRLSLVMEEYKGAWIVASSTVRSLYCRKS